MRNGLIVGVASILLTISFVVTAQAQSDAGAVGAPPAVTVTQPAQPVEAPPSTDFALIRTVGALGLVVSLIVIGFLAARKFMPQLFGRQIGGQRMKLVESLSMGDRRSIALVQVDDSWFVVGNTASQISLLARLPWEFSLSSEREVSNIGPSAGADSKDRPRKLYEVERQPASAGKAKSIPPDVRAKMRQLREALEQ